MKFLEQIADYYTGEGYRHRLNDLIFICPNKRSALFLKKYIQSRLEHGAWLMPRFSTFSRLAQNMTSLPEADRFEQLFLLYKCYTESARRHSRNELITDFDRFIFWGDMILSDFDEIDRSLADADKLYANLKAVNELTADFLTDEQKEVVRRIWGPTSLTQEIDSFWFPHGKDLDDTELSRKFIALWEILGEIYHDFRHELKERGLTTAGAAIREAYKIIKTKTADDLRPMRYIFVGLSDLSTAEIAIMEHLQRMGAASFFWDTQLPQYGKTHADQGMHDAIAMIRKLEKLYPSPADFTIETIDPVQSEIEIIGIPSSVGQAKYAAQLIRKRIKDKTLTRRNSLETAIVFPDPSLLMSLMLGLPEDIPGLNVTMGLPYQSTTFASLFKAIISMQLRARKRRGGRFSYFFQDVLEILVHPHIQALAPKHAEAFRQYIFDTNTFNLDAEELAGRLKEIDFIFRPIAHPDNAAEAYEYLINLIRGLRFALERNVAVDKMADSFEAQMLEYFESQVEMLYSLVKKYGISMHETTFITLFERIMRAKQLNLKGTPLSGVQVLGVLETRALDFDNLIIMSMNERTFPRRDYVHTMIPNALRRGYGLPPIERSQAFYTYYFYRAISRARNATLLYDSRTPGDKTFERSRFITQLIHLCDSDRITHRQLNLSGSVNSPREIVIEKTPEVIERLKAFHKNGSKSISATALKKYIQCPLAFYLQYVVGLKEDDTPVEYLDAAKLGTIFHETAQRLYDKHKNELITADVLDKMMSDQELDKILVSQLAENIGLNPATTTERDLPYEARLIKASTAFQLRTMLEAEKNAYAARDGGFTYVEGEREVAKPWQVSPNIPAINFKMFIDRIDRIANHSLRFIDYKTGSKDEYKVSGGIPNLFERPDAAPIFQLMLYAEAWHDLVDPADTIELKLNIVRKIISEGEIKPLGYTLDKNKTIEFQPFPAHSAEFRPRLNELFEKIFDDETPFGQGDPKECEYCPFIGVCGRLPKEESASTTLPTLV